MISESQFVGILDRLLARSRDNQVVWLANGYGGESYTVHFKSSSIVVGLASPSHEPDYYFAELQGSDDQVIASLRANREAGDYEPTNRDLLQDLYFDAKRCVYGWDKILQEIESALNSKETVGTKTPRVESAGDDIPF